MTATFDHGYALLIGVDENSVPEWALPDARKDVDALRNVLVNPARCAYRAENVKVLHGADATRQHILDGLEWLQTKIAADTSGNATAIIHYSGHGFRDTGANPPVYYLLPYDVQAGKLRGSALRAEDFAEAVAAVQPQRLLVILDCCHAGGIEARHLRLKPDQFQPAALPPTLLLGDSGSAAKAAGERGLDQLQLGMGRAVLSSSTGEQLAYVRSDGTMGIFTYHLIEALTGHAQPQGGAQEVLVSDVLSYVYRKVPETARAQSGRNQQPHGRMTGNFAVALLLGGKGLARGQSAPDPLADLAAAGQQQSGAGTSIHVSGSGAAAARGGVAAGAGGVAVGGDVYGSISLGGAGSKPNEKDDPQSG